MPCEVTCEKCNSLIFYGWDDDKGTYSFCECGQTYFKIPKINLTEGIRTCCTISDDDECI